MTGPQDPFATPGGDPPPPGGYGSAPTGPPSYDQPGQSYGQPQGYGQPYGAAPEHSGPKKNGFGVASLVLGVLSLFTWFFLIGGLFGLVAVILGFLGRGRAKRGEADNGGLALAGIITGILGMLLTGLVVAGVAALFGSGDFSNLAECVQEAGDDQAAVDECSRQFEDSLTGG